MVCSARRVDDPFAESAVPSQNSLHFQYQFLIRAARAGATIEKYLLSLHKGRFINYWLKTPRLHVPFRARKVDRLRVKPVAWFFPMCSARHPQDYSIRDRSRVYSKVG